MFLQYFFSRWPVVNNSRNKNVSAFLLYSIGFETINFYTFFIIFFFFLYQNYSFKNKEQLTITKIADILFVQQWFVKRCTKFQGKRANCSGTGARGTWQPMIFTYYASSSPSKFSWDSSFNLARSTCSFYWCYIFSFVIIFTKNINTEGKTQVIL